MIWNAFFLNSNRQIKNLHSNPCANHQTKVLCELSAMTLEAQFSLLNTILFIFINRLWLFVQNCVVFLIFTFKISWNNQSNWKNRIYRVELPVFNCFLWQLSNYIQIIKSNYLIFVSSKTIVVWLWKSHEISWIQFWLRDTNKI